MWGGAGAAKNLFPFSCGRVPTGHLLTCPAKGDRLAGPSSLVSGVLTASFDASTRQQNKREKKGAWKTGKEDIGHVFREPRLVSSSLPLQGKPEMSS